MESSKSEFEYEVVRSDRASRARIDVGLKGMKVVVPAGSGVDPHQLVAEKEEWVRAKLEKYERLREQIPRRRFVFGARFPFLGTSRELKGTAESSYRVDAETIHLPVERVEATSLRQELARFYRQEADEFFRQTAQRAASSMNVDYGTLSVKNQKTLWGSCTANRNLNFNWRLMMAPPEMAEYVVWHELAHLRVANHSNRFWDFLARYCSNPREKSRWLRDHSIELIFTRDDL